MKSCKFIKLLVLICTVSLLTASCNSSDDPINYNGSWTISNQIGIQCTLNDGLTSTDTVGVATILKKFKSKLLSDLSKMKEIDITLKDNATSGNLVMYYNSAAVTGIFSIMTKYGGNNYFEIKAPALSPDSFYGIAVRNQMELHFPSSFIYESFSKNGATSTEITFLKKIMKSIFGIAIFDRASV